MQRPSISRIVHWYSAPDAEPLPAIVTKVYSDTCVRLTVFGADGRTFLSDSVEEASETSSGRAWVWPPREYVPGDVTVTIVPYTGGDIKPPGPVIVEEPVEEYPDPEGNADGDA